MIHFNELPSPEEFDDTFKDLWGSYVDARIAYPNCEEEYYFPGAYDLPGLDGVYAFLKDTVKPGESFDIALGEYDPTL